MVEPAQAPVVITPVFTTTPERFEDELTNKLPPIPTPPVTFNAPVDVEVLVVESVTARLEEKVFSPANVCAKVETNPVDPEPAIGILKVCVEPLEDILKPVPLVPIAKYCKPEVIPFKVVIPAAEVGCQETKNGAVLSDVRTYPFEPMGNANIDVPAPTRMSPKLYEVFPVPPLGTPKT